MSYKSLSKNLLAILVLLTVYSGWPIAASKVTLVNNGFQNILVAISAPAYRSGLEDGLKSLLTATSATLMKATGNRTYFNSISILQPSIQSNLRGKSLHRVRRDNWEAYPSFETADIRVDVDNVAYGNYPYTQQSRGCGEPGDFIHLTPDFILSFDQVYGSPDRLLANEWIKYRYGVFDENGHYDSDRYPQKYYSQNTLNDNVCSNSVVTWSQNTCDEDISSIGVPAECTLIPDVNSNSNLKSSMMSLPLTTLATEYCNESNHNAEAPNIQNILCGGKSIMEVVLSHSDFAKGANPPNYNNFKATTFSTTNEADSNLALIILWDPMDRTSTYDSIRPSLMKFITKDFPNNSYFGMIQTIDPAGIPLYPLTLISEQTDRSTIISRIKLMAFSITGTRTVNDVLNDAISMFSSSSIPIQNQAVLLLSNSINSTDLTTSCNTANSSSIQLHYVTYTANKAQNFLNIQSCPGNVYLIESRSCSTSDAEVNKCFINLQNRARLDDTFMSLPAIIAPDAFTNPIIFHQYIYTTSQNGTFVIDVPIENADVYFYIEGCDMYDTKSEDLIPTHWIGNPYHQIMYDENTVAFFEPSLLDKNGAWNFGVATEPTYNFTIPYVVYAVGRSRPVSTDATPSIQATAWVVIDTEKNLDGIVHPRVRVFATVKRGTSPVFNAKVEANIITTNGNTTYTVPLYDDASGNPDIAVQDGIYSSYFTPWGTTTEMYITIVTVTDNNGAATTPTNQYAWISKSSMATEFTGTFHRTIQLDSFDVTPLTTDVIPPGPIDDFRVQSINGAQVILEWTAPGYDYDYGQASRYFIRCSTDRSVFEGVTKLDTISSATVVTAPTPQKSKNVQTVTLTNQDDQMTHYCAIQAQDNVNNYGPVSPIISYYILDAVCPLIFANTDLWIK